MLESWYETQKGGSRVDSRGPSSSATAWGSLSDRMAPNNRAGLRHRYRILQAMVLAVRNFQSDRVSDLNRKRTHQIECAGTESAHYVDGGRQSECLASAGDLIQLTNFH